MCLDVDRTECLRSRVGRAMAKSPEDRYQSVGEMLADLEVMAGTLSGQTLAALPSETGIRRAGLMSTVPAGVARFRPRRVPTLPWASRHWQLAHLHSFFGSRGPLLTVAPACLLPMFSQLKSECSIL